MSDRIAVADEGVRAPIRSRRLGRGDVGPVAVAFFVAGAGLAQLSVDGAQLLTQADVNGFVEPGDCFGETLAAGDFDNDGVDDLAIGAPCEAIGLETDAGAVAVIYGGHLGLNRGTRQGIYFHQNSTGVQGVSEAGDRFGASLAAGDFTGDGWDELAVGVPWEDTQVPLGDGAFLDYTDNGIIQVFLGGIAGIVPAADQLVDGDSFPGTIFYADGDLLGRTLHASDINRDGYHDLMIGLPTDGRDAGAVLISRGAPTGLGDDLNAYFGSISDQPADFFGQSLVSGNFDTDEFVEWGYGAPGFDASANLEEVGAAWFFSGAGAPAGSTGVGAGARYGWALAAGDFRGIGRDVTLVGSPGFDASSQDEAGRVSVIDPVLGSAFHLSQGSGNMSGTAEPFDNLGEALAVGDFNRDGYDDAVLGAPRENLPGALDAGVFHLVYGGPLGLSTGNEELWTLASPLPFSFSANDRFGMSFAVGDFNGDGVDDLAIGVPGAEVLAEPGSGMVAVAYGFDPTVLFADGFESGGTSEWSEELR